MGWDIEYYEQADTTQPAEEFEDYLKRYHKKLGAKLWRIAVQIKIDGPHQLGGGLVEPCSNYKGMWEMRTIFNNFLGRDFFGCDGSRVVLLHGYVKRVDEEASIPDFDKAYGYLRDYQRTYRISPEKEEQS